MYNTPILFLIFNRIDSTIAVFEKIRSIKPKQLFIAADGPRTCNVGEEEKCNEVRRYVLSNIDWDCEVKTLFREDNFGCGKAVSSAISWFFNSVDEGIILEDDCLPSYSFFTYCNQLLEKYRDENNIFMISGNNFQKKAKIPDSYYFSSYAHIWGWATWKRSWDKYSFTLNGISETEFRLCLKRYFITKLEIDYWVNLFYTMKNNPIDTWDYQLLFAQWINNGLTILPNSNLVTNIGFNENATHTKSHVIGVSELKSFEINDLKHNDNVTIDRKADLYTFRRIFSDRKINTWNKVKFEIIYNFLNLYSAVNHFIDT
jgi:hypothetical protein